MKSVAKWAIAGLLAVNLPWMAAESAQAGSIKSLASFQCQQVNGYYATVAVQRSGRSAPVIAWTSEEFSDAGYTPQRRCGEVTSRLNSVLRDNGNRLSNLYLTVGRVNGHTVVCSVNNTQSGCNRNNVLFTLSQTNRRSNDPREILARLFNTRVLSSGSSVQESGGQPYVNLEHLVNQLF
jgi:hypothetical protein